MLDPTCADITGRVLEALAAHGVAHDHAAVRRGVKWLVRHQEADGSWYGRWGVAYIYGTCFALRGLAASGENDREAHVLRAGDIRFYKFVAPLSLIGKMKCRGLPCAPAGLSCFAYSWESLSSRGLYGVTPCRDASNQRIRLSSSTSSQWLSQTTPLIRTRRPLICPV